MCAHLVFSFVLCVSAGVCQCCVCVCGCVHALKDQPTCWCLQKGLVKWFSTHTHSNTQGIVPWANLYAYCCLIFLSQGHKTRDAGNKNLCTCRPTEGKTERVREQEREREMCVVFYVSDKHRAWVALKSKRLPRLPCGLYNPPGEEFFQTIIPQMSEKRYKDFTPKACQERKSFLELQAKVCTGNITFLIFCLLWQEIFVINRHLTLQPR